MDATRRAGHLDRVPDAAAGHEELFAGRAALARAALVPYAHSDSPAPAEGTLDGLCWLLAELGDLEPLLLAVDDAQWADEESVAFLRFVALRLAGVPAAVVLATRPPAAHESLAGLLTDQAAHMARPPALGLEGTARYLGRELGTDPSAAFTAACLAATGGNPS